MNALKRWCAQWIAALRGDSPTQPPTAEPDVNMAEAALPAAAPAAPREALPVSAVPGVEDAASYWPASIAHLALPYDNGGSDYVTVAEISEAPINGYVGSKRVAVALVPLELVEQVLQSTAATGHEVDSQGPLPIVGDEGPPHSSGFWIEGFDRDMRFEPLVNAWSGSDIDVVVPDNNLLMVFALVPRQTGASSISWDDPCGPVYDVVRASTISDHHLVKEERQRAFVEIRRDYLLEYCRIKQAAAVAFYYERREANGDPVFDQVMAGADNEDFHLPGRLLNLQVHPHDEHGERQFAQVWGRRIVIQKGERRVFVEDDPDLAWPDHSGSMTMHRAGREHAMAYVSDQVLRDYEGRPELEIHPLSGGVSYRGQWSVAYCKRLGRDHIAVEIKKLYEGCPIAVIQHWHRFALPHALASADQAANNGNRNIGVRAQELVHAYLTLTRTLASLVERLGLSFDEAEIGGSSTKEVEYSGWWTFKELKPLANVVPPNITLEAFLDRTVAVVKLWESLKEAPLRNILLKLGLDRKATEQLKPTKLLAAICQLATIGRRAGFRWPDDSSSFVKEWDKDLRLDCFVRLFAVNQLRQKAAHRTGDDVAASLAKDLDGFAIVEVAQAGGWGHAVDTVYDRLIADIDVIAGLLAPDR
jgi:hypothetical protein